MATVVKRIIYIFHQRSCIEKLLLRVVEMSMAFYGLNIRKRSLLICPAAGSSGSLPVAWLQRHTKH
jgi:hypothetical protein